MKVSDAPKGLVTTAQLPASSTEGVARGTTSGPVPDRVSVLGGTMVDEAARIARANRTSRLKEVEAAVNAGSYRPNPSLIADRILEDAELAARVRNTLLK